MTLVRCLDCAKFSVQRAPELRQRDGFGCCERYPEWLVFSAEKARECGCFEKADAGTIEKRERWIHTNKAESLRYGT